MRGSSRWDHGQRSRRTRDSADVVLRRGRIVAAIDIGTLIVRSSEIRGGRPRFAGTGVTVRTIAVCRLHAEYLTRGQSHAGIIVVAQQQYSVGEQLRRLLRLMAAHSDESMRDRVEFLSAWG